MTRLIVVLVGTKRLLHVAAAAGVVCREPDITLRELWARRAPEQ